MKKLPKKLEQIILREDFEEFLRILDEYLKDYFDISDVGTLPSEEKIPLEKALLGRRIALDILKEIFGRLTIRRENLKKALTKKKRDLL